MMKQIANLLINIVKKLIISVLLIYGLNLLTSPLNLIVPINIYTALVVALLDIPGIFALVALLFLL